MDVLIIGGMGHGTAHRVDFAKAELKILSALSDLDSCDKMFVVDSLSDIGKTKLQSLADELKSSMREFNMPFDLDEGPLKFWATDFYFPQKVEYSLEYTDSPETFKHKIIKQPPSRVMGYRRGQKRKF